MKKQTLPLDRILHKLDEYLHKDQYTAAETHLSRWLTEAEMCGDGRAALALRNERMGLFRKLGREEEALTEAAAALALVETHGWSAEVGAATTYLNAATVYKAFGRSAEAIPLFETAWAVYERELSPHDPRRAGLCNNMALALVDVGRLAEAQALYRQALDILSAGEGNRPEMAVTYLNMANAIEAEKGLEDGAQAIEACLDHAEALLETHGLRDGHYAFVCEKCAPTFDYYGRFAYAAELSARVRRIYEGT